MKVPHANPAGILPILLRRGWLGSHALVLIPTTASGGTKYPTRYGGFFVVRGIRYSEGKARASGSHLGNPHTQQAILRGIYGKLT